MTHPLSNGSRRYDKHPWIARLDFPDLESRISLLCQELTGGGWQDGSCIPLPTAMPLARHDSQVCNLSWTLRVLEQRVVQDDSGHRS